MKLAQETEKLKAELKALTDRLEAAEEREGKLMEHPSPRDMHDTLKHPWILFILGTIYHVTPQCIPSYFRYLTLIIYNPTSRSP